MKRKWLWGIVALTVAGVPAAFFLNQDDAEWVTELVQQGALSQEVSVTGAVEANTTVDLRFNSSGNVDELLVSLGETVSAGQKLMRLDLGKLQAEVDRAAAGIRIAEAELQLMMAGPSDEEIALSEAKLNEAELNLNNARTEYENTLLTSAESVRQAELELDKTETAYETAVASQANTADQIEVDLAAAYEDSQPNAQNALDAVLEGLNNTDSLLGIDDDPLDNAFENAILDSSLSLRMNLETAYYEVQREWSRLESETVSLSSSWEGEAAELLLADVLDATEYAKDMVDWAVEVIENMEDLNSSQQANADTLMATLQLDQSALSTRIGNLQNDIQAIANAKLGNTSSGLSADSEVSTSYNNVQIAESKFEAVQVESAVAESNALMNIDVMGSRLDQRRAEHANLIAAPREVDVAAQRARVAQAQAAYSRAVADRDDAVLYAPADGVVAKVHVDPGQSVSSADAVISFITDDLQVAANISETEVALVSMGDSVEMTLDAFDVDEVFTGKLVSLDPAETVIQGVVYYEATVLFDEVYEGIRPGMTVNLDVLTDENEAALYVPSQAIQFEGTETFVYVIEGEERERRVVKTGIQSDRSVEILEGLEIGETVLLYEK